MRTQSLTPLHSVTPLIAVLFAPVPAYVLWMNFKRYAHSPLLLLIPAVLALLAGYLERKRNPFVVALWLVAATYCVIVIDAIRLTVAGQLPWPMLLPVIAGACVWTVVIIGLPAWTCTALGRWLREWRA
jgi:hypothetical protein